MHRGLWIIGAIFVAIILVPIIFHLTMKRYVTASLLSGLCVGLVSGLLFAWTQAIELGIFFIAVVSFGLAAFVIALGIGIPFNRKRNPLPPEGAGGAVGRMFTRHIPAIEMVLSIVFAVVLWKLVSFFDA